MQRDEIQEIFDRQAASYDKQWSKLAPIRDTLHLLMGGLFAKLPVEANMLCVGAGTGAELFYLAGQFPQWRFTVVEPSPAMLQVCRQGAEERGIAARCTFHEGYLESLPVSMSFHAATALLVSQFLMEPEARIDFFRNIARRMHPEGILVSSDLSADTHSTAYENLLNVWLGMMGNTGIPPEGLQNMHTAYGRDVAISSTEEIEAYIAAGGFKSSLQFFQAGLIRAWYSIRG